MKVNIYVQSIHNGVKYTGEYCDYKATRKGNLNIHAQYIHNGVKYTVASTVTIK